MISRTATVRQSTQATKQLRSRAITRTRGVATWSGDFSFASPETDFYRGASPRHQQQHQRHRQQQEYRRPVVTDVSSKRTMWSQSLSYASPEADFTTTMAAVAANAAQTPSSVAAAAAHTIPQQRGEVVQSRTIVPSLSWSDSYSFASPESDFTFHLAAAVAESEEEEWSEQLTFASPETDFVATAPHMAVVADTDRVEEEWSATVSFASPEADFTATSSAVAQLEDSSAAAKRDAILQDALAAPLPMTFADALLDPRPIVITEVHSPFRIVDVNDAWVGLCEYSREEAQDMSLRILQGPETDRTALLDMVQSLQEQHQMPESFSKDASEKDVRTVLVSNYTKSGRKFVNRLRTGPLWDEQHRDKVTHFVGVLHEVLDEEVEAGQQQNMALAA